MGDKLLVGNRESNPKGHYEDTELVMLNERVISGNWRDPVVVDTPIYRQRYLRYVMGRNGRQGRDSLWGVKDPRMCFTFPMFREALDAAGCPFRVVVSSRPREAVVKSLEKRDSLSGVPAGLIYERYQDALARVLETVPSKQMMIVPFGDLLADPEVTLQRIAFFIGHEVIPELLASAEAFVDPKLDHWGAVG